MLNRLPGRRLSGLRQRYHPQLSGASVYAFSHALIGFEFYKRLQNIKHNQLSMARNAWYQDRALRVLHDIEQRFSERPILFSYSYGARDLFRYAKDRGWRTILGQIDPGPVDEELILEEHRRNHQYGAIWRAKPSSYWRSWEEECSLADVIVANSTWSRRAIELAGIPGDKIEVIPLAYQASDQALHHIRTYPSAFSSARPLRVLYLGQITLRKGIAAMVAAADMLTNFPVEFRVVGPRYITLPQKATGNIKWLGPVSRSETAQYYRDADVFLFPTLSDGFGLTQLEAQAWKLPVIASRYCGEVVRDNVNGIVLDKVSGESIAGALQRCLDSPELLRTFSGNSVDMNEYSLDRLRRDLRKLA